MSYLNLRDEEEKAKIIADNKEETPRNIHKTMSTLYFGVIVLLIPVVLCGLVFDAKEFAKSYVIDSLWVIVSIFISRILINKKKITIAYLVLFSAPVVVFIYETLVWYANMGCKTLSC